MKESILPKNEKSHGFPCITSTTLLSMIIQTRPGYKRKSIKTETTEGLLEKVSDSPKMDMNTSQYKS